MFVAQPYVKNSSVELVMTIFTSADMRDLWRLMSAVMKGLCSAIRTVPSWKVLPTKINTIEVLANMLTTMSRAFVESVSLTSGKIRTSEVKRDKSLKVL